MKFSSQSPNNTMINACFTELIKRYQHQRCNDQYVKFEDKIHSITL